MLPINLFEYQNKEPLVDIKSKDFLDFLNKVWQEREKSIFYRNIPKEKEVDEIEKEIERDDDLKEQQQFISFFNDKTIKARNFVGVIHYNGVTLNLLPKIFYEGKDKSQTANLDNIQKNILWW